MKTWIANPEEQQQKWWIVDATNLTLGRMASEIAQVIRGKNKPTFTPNVDTGDFVIVVNADKIKLSGAKLEQKNYYRHSRFFGSLKTFRADNLLVNKPSYMIEEAVKGMLPKNKLGRALGTKLKVYSGAEHPHATQKPEALNLK